MGISELSHFTAWWNNLYLYLKAMLHSYCKTALLLFFISGHVQICFKPVTHTNKTEQLYSIENTYIFQICVVQRKWHFMYSSPYQYEFTKDRKIDAVNRRMCLFIHHFISVADSDYLLNVIRIESTFCNAYMYV